MHMCKKPGIPGKRSKPCYSVDQEKQGSTRLFKWWINHDRTNKRQKSKSVFNREKVSEWTKKQILFST